jgi:hypothetical protein
MALSTAISLAIQASYSLALDLTSKLSNTLKTYPLNLDTGTGLSRPT